MNPLASFATWLRFALANTRRNRRRSLVTLAITALGTAGLLLAGGFALYTYQSLEQMAARTTGHLVIAKPQAFERDEDTPLQHGLEQAGALRRRLLDDPAVRQVLPRVEFNGLISNGDKSTVMVAAGIDPEAEFAVKGPFLSVKAGRLLGAGDRAGVLLGDRLARSLKARPGASLTLLASTVEGALNALDVTVIGIVATGVPDLDARLVYTDIATAQQLLASSRVTHLGVFLDRMDHTSAAQQRLQALWPQLKVQTWLDQAVFYKSVRALYHRIFGALGLVIAVIVVFVIANAMAMSVIERTREVGTLRALGAHPRELLTSFALEGLLLGSAGAALGGVLALGVTALLWWFPVEMPPPPGRSTGYPLQIALDPLLYATVLFAAMALSTLVSALTARRAVHQPVVQALAHV